MKKFCECNGNCDEDYDLRFCVEMDAREEPEDFTKHDYPYDYAFNGRGPSEYCEVCTYFFWYRADHENMMHDLREMNR